MVEESGSDLLSRGVNVCQVDLEEFVPLSGVTGGDVVENVVRIRARPLGVVIDGVVGVVVVSLGRHWLDRARSEQQRLLGKRSRTFRVKCTKRSRQIMR